MDSSTYIPAPIETSDIELPSELDPLLEQLARNNHETWAHQRFCDGWTFGPHRDDAAKQHPGLVHFDQLAESEKEYDRRTVVETLKAIVSLGFRIEKAD